MSSSRAVSVPSRTPDEVDDRGNVLAASAGVTPHVLIDAEDLHALESGVIADQDPAALLEHGELAVLGDPSASAMRAMHG